MFWLILVFPFGDVLNYEFSFFISLFRAVWVRLEQQAGDVCCFGEMQREPSIIISLFHALRVRLEQQAGDVCCFDIVQREASISISFFYAVGVRLESSREYVQYYPLSAAYQSGIAP